MMSDSSPPTSPSPKRVRFNPVVLEIEPIHFAIANNPFDDECSSDDEEEGTHYETITTSSSTHTFNHFDHGDEILPALVYSYDSPSAANLQHSIQNAYDELMDITAELFPSSTRSGVRGEQGLDQRCRVFPSEIWRKPAWRDGAVTARGVREEDQSVD